MKLLNVSQVCDTCGISRSRLYGLIKAGEFPPGILISKGSRRWPSEAVEGWIREKIANADAAERSLGQARRAASRRAVEARLARRALG
ncbi:MAG: hypothetical protein DI596_12625 [Azospira oryzae]|nr:MAG: hypothetical protein DI596_12625 [Azospira oryzae]PZP77364.1 MAG: hypothetical protein DI593_12625 [Azospira oryzae]